MFLCLGRTHQGQYLVVEAKGPEEELQYWQYNSKHCLFIIPALFTFSTEVQLDYKQKKVGEDGFRTGHAVRQVCVLVQTLPVPQDFFSSPIHKKWISFLLDRGNKMVWRVLMGGRVCFDSCMHKPTHSKMSLHSISSTTSSKAESASSLDELIILNKWKCSTQEFIHSFMLHVSHSASDSNACTCRI